LDDGDKADSSKIKGHTKDKSLKVLEFIKY